MPNIVVNQAKLLWDVRKWDREAQWDNVLTDLEGQKLLAADSSFVYMVQNDGKLERSSRQIVRTKSGRRFIDLISVTDDPPYDIIRFFDTYPYLSYVLAGIYPVMILFAIAAGQTDFPMRH